MDTLNATFKSLSSANMAAAVSMSILYGAYLLVYPTCIYVLLGHRARGQPIHWVLLSCVTIQFIVLTIEVVVQLDMLFQSFIGLADKPNALIQLGLYWATLNTPIHTLAHVCSLINVAIGDAIIVWRVWILFHNHAFLVCLPPILTLIGSTTCGIVMVHAIWQGVTLEFIRHIATTAWSLGMFTQGYSTAVIAWQIWHLGFANAKAGNSRSITSFYRAVIVMVIESGAIYTALVLPLTVSYAVGANNAAIALVGALDPMAAIVPASIVILVGIKRNHQFRTTVLSQVAPLANGEKMVGVGQGVGIVFAKTQRSVDEDTV